MHVVLLAVLLVGLGEVVPLLPLTQTVLPRPLCCCAALLPQLPPLLTAAPLSNRLLAGRPLTLSGCAWIAWKSGGWSRC